MGFRDRVAKIFGVPPQIAEANEAAGMTPQTPFSPGEPIRPYDGYGRVPRAQDFRTGYNISSRPRANERVSFTALRGIIDNYDVASICIRRRIDAMRKMSWSLVAAPGVDGDVSEAIRRGTTILKRPDRQNLFGAWLAEYLYDVLAFDAGCLYRLRNRRGDAIGLRVIDGTTIAPMLDDWGGSPEAPAVAYGQYVQGLGWNWLTRNDLIYQPFNPRSNSPYGMAPIENVLLNANTDLRFQQHFLQRFTDGNIPEAFAAAPENWTPQQIRQMQETWDGLLKGDQTIMSQIKWVPGGTQIIWSNEKEFSDKFSLYLMRKTAAAFNVTPASLGFTDTVNKSSGESQADVQEGTGDSPLAAHVEDILSAFLQEDCGLPLAFQFSDGSKDQDLKQRAEAWKIFIDTGMVSADEGREQLTGLPADPRNPTPRIMMTSQGPIPISAITSAPVDAETGVEKETTTGITAATGVHGNPMVSGGKPAEDEETRERAAFHKFAAARRRQGKWRDFEFRAVDALTAHRLNDRGRLAVRKAAGEVGVAGLAVLAADTGRVLMLQRALTDDDPAGGCWEFPGGHLDTGETPMAGACREWAEETGCIPPSGVEVGRWTSGVYQGIVWRVDHETDVPIMDGRDAVTNPDDPDGDQVEALAWWDPTHLSDNPAVRPELAASLGDILPLLGVVAKAGGPPKAQAPSGRGGVRSRSSLIGVGC